MKLSQVIGFDWSAAVFDIGSHDLKGNSLQASTPNTRYGVDDVNKLLMQIANSGDIEQHKMLAAQIVEPIMKVVPYVEMFGPTFFQDVNYGDLEDNPIPVEDLPTMAFETHLEGAVKYTRAGYTWTRPGFISFDYGIEVKWADLKRAGWNFLARQMKYASWDLARKHDVLSRNVLDAAIAATDQYAVSGGKLTKASVDAVLKAKAAIGFPVSRVLINSGTIMDMATFTWPSGFLLPPEEARSVIKTLYIGDYGGAQWFISPNAPTNKVYFGGTPDQIGWHQTRGQAKSASDVDITNKRDLHAFYDLEHAYYVGSGLTLASLVITA